MLKKILIATIAFLALSNINTNAQELPVFGITGVNTDEFPLVKSYIIAKNGYLNEDYYQGKQNILNPTEFDLVENGISQDDLSLALKCDELDDELPVHIALVVDASFSMFLDWRNGETRADVLERAANEFIDSVQFKNGSSLFIVPFAGNSIPNDVWKDWNYTKADAKSDFAFYRELTGRTDFNTPMFEEPSGKNVLEIFKSRPPTERRVVVFLTDGEHDDPVGTNPFETNKVIEQLQSRGIQFYSITFAATENGSAFDLEQVSFATGGKYFNANNEEELRDVYREISDNFKSTSLCWLEWISKLQCEEVTENNVTATFKRKQYDPISRDFTYLPPADKAIASIVRDKDVMYFDNSGKTTQEITLTAQVGDFNVTGFDITNNNLDFDIPEFAAVPPNGFIIEEGNSKKFVVNYIKNPSDAPVDFELIFETDLCPVKPIKLVAPCKPDTKLVEFGNVNLSGSTDLIVNNAFTNNSTGELSGTVTVQGTYAAEFSVKSVNGNLGDTYTLAAGESMDVELTITPTSTGDKTAQLNYGIITDCGVALSDITAKVIEADLNLPAHNWDLVRIQNPIVYNYVIENTNADDVEIEDITLSDANKGFALGDINTSIGVVAKNGGSTSFDVTFTPDVEGPVSVKLQVKLKNRVELLTAKLSGIGFLPEIKGNSINFTPTEIYTDATPANFVIENNSDYGVMVIKDVYLKGGTNPDFTLDKSGFTNNTAINKTQSITIPVTFNPSAIGNRSAIIVVEADNISGEEPVTFVLNEFTLDGEGIPGDEVNLPLQEIGPILSCESTPFNLLLENDTDKEVTVNGVLTQVGSNFNLISNSFTIPANGTTNAMLEYTPSGIGVHQATAKFSYSDGLIVNAPLQGTANVMNADIIEFSEDEYINEIAKYFTPKFTINLGDYNIRTDVAVNKLTLTLAYNGTVLGMQEDDIVTNIGVNPVIDNSNLLQSGISTLTFNGSIPLDKDLTFEIPYQLLLGNDTATTIKVDAVFESLSCLNIETGTTNSITTGCNLRNTTIQSLVFEDQGYNMNIVSENPTNEKIELEYELPFKSYFEVSISNSIGNLLLDESIWGEFGINTISYDVSRMSSGVYYIRFTSGPFSKTEKFIIVK